MAKAQDAEVFETMDRVSALLVVTHEGGTADHYLQDFPFWMGDSVQGDMVKGEAIGQSGIADVRRLRHVLA